LEKNPQSKKPGACLLSVVLRTGSPHRSLSRRNIGNALQRSKPKQQTTNRARLLARA